MGSIPGSPLGKATHYPQAYDPALLYPVERAPQRAALGLADALPFRGVDRWTAWEAGWLDAQGRARVAIVTFDVPCTSPRIVESKSVKLWLTSLNHATFADAEALRTTMARDLGEATGAEVAVAVHLPAQWPAATARQPLQGTAIDDVLPAVRTGAPDPALLACGAGVVEETLVTHAFRSVCPVTGQPDYAELRLAYRGAPLRHAALACYLAGYRQHPGFHEHCVERIFVDVWASCRPERLVIEARFSRRGGVDINPLRASVGDAQPSPPTFRQ